MLLSQQILLEIDNLFKNILLLLNLISRFGLISDILGPSVSRHSP